MTTQEIINSICNGQINKGQLIKLAYGEKSPRGIDPALPLELTDTLRKNGINTSFIVYDCNINKPVNLLEKIFFKLFDLDHNQCLTILGDIHGIYEKYKALGL